MQPVKLILFVFLIQLSCKSGDASKDKASVEDLPNVTEIAIKSVNIGLREETEITPKNLQYSLNNPDRLIDKYTLEVSAEQWKALRKEVSKINLEEIKNLKAPTNKRLFDGDMATVVHVKVDGEEFKSVTYDKKNPPEELQALVNQVYGMLKEE